MGAKTKLISNESLEAFIKVTMQKFTQKCQTFRLNVDADPALDKLRMAFGVALGELYKAMVREHDALEGPACIEWLVGHASLVEGTIRRMQKPHLALQFGRLRLMLGAEQKAGGAGGAYEMAQSNFGQQNMVLVTGPATSTRTKHYSGSAHRCHRRPN